MNKNGMKKCGHPYGYKCGCNTPNSQEPTFLDLVAQMKKNRTQFNHGLNICAS